MKAEELKATISYLEDLLEHNPADLAAHSLLGECFHHTGNYDAALWHYDCAMDLDYDAFWPRFGRDRLLQSKVLNDGSLNELATRLEEIKGHHSVHDPLERRLDAAGPMNRRVQPEAEPEADLVNSLRMEAEKRRRAHETGLSEALDDVARHLDQETKRYTEKEILSLLLTAEDLPGVISEISDSLDSKFVKRVRNAIEFLKRKHQLPLARKMVLIAALAESALIDKPRAATHARNRQAKMLESLLSADDPMEVFVQHRAALDTDFLALVRTVADVARPCGCVEFAEAFDNLAECVGRFIENPGSAGPDPMTVAQAQTPLSSYGASMADGVLIPSRIADGAEEQHELTVQPSGETTSLKISVITPTRNCAQFIRTCIDSVLAQDYENFEHIIVDGASKDGTVEILRQYPHVRWVSEPDNGEADALNKALRVVTGDIVYWLNADDWLLPGVFKAAVEEFTKSPGACVVYGNTNMVDETGQILALKKSATCITLGFLTRWWRCPAHPHQPSMFFSKAVIDDLGPFRQDLYFSVDYEYWMRAILKFPFRYVDKVFSESRMRVDSKGLNTEAGQIESHWKVSLPYHEHLSPDERELFWTEYYLHRLFERKDPEATRQPNCGEASIGLALALLKTPRMDAAFNYLFPDAGEQAAVKRELYRFIPLAGTALRPELEKVCKAVGAALPVSDQAKTIPVLWCGPVFDPSGYADQARNFIKTMGTDWPVYLRPAGNLDNEFVSGMEKSEYRDLTERIRNPVAPYISLLSVPAYAFQRDPNALYNVGKTVFETDRLSPEWVSRCNEMDEIWVPTGFNAETFAQSGVKVPLVVIPEGVDPDFYRPGLEPLPIPGRRGFAFLSIFEWTFRKGWDLLLRTWAEAFSPADDVCLILRAYPVKADKTKPRSIKARVEAYYDSIGLTLDQIAPVIILEDQVPQRQMPNLYAAADAFVLPSRGEGWGRPYIESMSCELPVIGTGWGGNLEYMNRDNAYLIETKGLERIDEKMEFPFYRGHCWSCPSPDHLVSLMKEVFSNRDIAVRKGKRARQDMIARWTWKSSAEKALARIKEISTDLDGKSKRSSLPAFRLRWEGSQFVGHSLALINRELCLSLIDSSCEVSIITGNEKEDINPHADPRFKKIVQRAQRDLSGKPDVHVRHQWPPNFTPPPQGHWVMIQPWEYGRLPESWIEPMTNLVDEIWVPSRHVLKTCVASGIPAERVQVVPNGVNVNQFYPGASKRPIESSKKYRFLFVGGGLWRKGIDVLLDAYASAFSSRDDVVLIVKDLPNQKFYIDQGVGKIIGAMQKNPHAPEILYLNTSLEPEELPGLYTACDCLVHPYRGEGFGLPVLEAMACGIPVITTSGGSTDDFCSPEQVFLIPSSRREFNPKDIKLAGGSGWVLEPDFDALKNLMRQAFENKEEARQRALKVSEFVRRHYGWQTIAEKILARIDLLSRQPVRREGRL